MSQYEFHNPVFDIVCKGTKKKPQLYQLKINGKAIATSDFDFNGEYHFSDITQVEEALDYPASSYPKLLDMWILLDEKSAISMLCIRRTKEYIQFEYMVSVYELLPRWNVNAFKVALLFFKYAQAKGYHVDPGETEYYIRNLSTSVDIRVPAKGNLLAHHQKHYKQLNKLWKKAFDKVKGGVLKEK